jgi:uroporphyrin-III C-methyltransferase/precorrin-2 dehydrogenase/sirohydrochlorin ferrochelatase
MNLFPLFADLKGRPCLVVGGGEVARRKVEMLLKAGAQVTVNAPDFAPPITALGAAGRVRLQAGTFDPALVPQHWLVVAATSDATVNRAVAAAAEAATRFCNVVDGPGDSSFISPSVVDRSPIIVAVSSGGESPVLARLVRQELERLLPARLGELAGWAGRWRTAVRARFPTVDDRRRFWERVLAGPLARHVLAGRTGDADQDMQAALADAGHPGSGEAWLVGAGPGDPELLTLKGFQVLQQAEVILYDRLVSPGVLAYARRDAELIEVGKTGGGPSTSQATINELLVSRVRAGQRVCRLKGGDPFVFGRGGEEAAALAAAGLPFQVVPGITAALGCGAYAGIPVTHRGLATAVVLATGELAADSPSPDWPLLARPGSTAVIYMATRKLADVAGSLIAAGRPAGTPAAVVAAGTLPNQQVVRATLGTLAAAVASAGLSPPAVLIVGEVADLAATIGWFTPAPAGGAAGCDNEPAPPSNPTGPGSPP